MPRSRITTACDGITGPSNHPLRTFVRATQISQNFTPFGITAELHGIMLGMRRNCPACGEKAEPNSSWCRYCGSQIYSPIPWMGIILVAAIVVLVILIILVLDSMGISAVKHHS